MRALSVLAGFLAATALGYAGGMALIGQAAPGAVAVTGERAAALATSGPTGIRATDAGLFPAVFGTYVEPEAPAAELEPEPEPPPVVNRNFTLRGVYVGEDGAWAIVADGAGEYLLRTGDRFQDYATVAEIGPGGVWLDTEYGREVIGFE